MLKITKEFTVFDVNDVKADAKLKSLVLKNYNFDEFAYECYAGDIIAVWINKLDKLGFYNPKVMYSGFYSQGDGASFTADDIYLKVL